MSLFKKPKKNIVQRRAFTENDDEDDESVPMDIQEIQPIERKSKKKDKSSKPKQTLLSFDAEEEGEVFQVKKSSHSKKVLRMFEKEKRKKEIKQENKEEVKPKNKTEIVTDDLVLVVNSSHKKPSTPPPPLILSGRDALCAGKSNCVLEYK